MEVSKQEDANWNSQSNYWARQAFSPNSYHSSDAGTHLTAKGIEAQRNREAIGDAESSSNRKPRLAAPGAARSSGKQPGSRPREQDGPAAQETHLGTSTERAHTP